MPKKRPTFDDGPRTARERPRPRPAARGCSITTILTVLIVLVLGLIGFVGYLYLKDSNWVGKRNIQLDNRSKKTGGFFETTPRDNGKRTNASTDRIDELIRKVVTEPSGAAEKRILSKRTALPVKSTNAKQTPAGTQTKPGVRKTAVVTQKKTASQSSVKNTATAGTAAKTRTAVKTASSTAGPRDVKIYFIRYNAANESVSLAATTRRLAASDQPLVDTLSLLFKGTTSEEDDQQYSSAIPGDVSIRSVKVSGGVATVDLSANFESGTGKKMMQARVYQVVYTATQYSSVTKVQILLNGRADPDFGGEGIDLTRPLARMSAPSPAF